MCVLCRLVVAVGGADEAGQAVKEFSKSRLRKRAQSEMLRSTGPGRGRRPAKLAAPELDADALGPDNLSLIREFGSSERV